MKKRIIVLLLCCFLTGVAFAQLNFNGEVYAGIQLRIAPETDESITADHRDYGAPEFHVSATASRENYGARLVTEFKGTDFSVTGIYGWVDFLNNSLRLSLGQFSDGHWVTQLDSDLPALTLDHITGFRITYDLSAITPVLQGLNVGVAFRTVGENISELGRQAIFGATYANPLFSAIFVYDLGQNVRTLFGFNIPSFGFVGLPDLSVGFNLHATALSTWSATRTPSGVLTLYQRVGYRVSWPISVSLIAHQRFFGNPNMNYAGMMFGPGVTYRHSRVPNLTASLRVMIESPDHFSTTDLIIRPAIEKALAGPALFYLQYEARLPDVGAPGNRAVHTVGFGIEIRAF